MKQRLFSPTTSIRSSSARRSWILLALLVFSLGAPATAQALYLDPATGSILLQMIVGGVAGAVMLMKLYWRRLTGFFGSSEAKDDESPG